MVVLIFGGNGMLGHKLVQTLSERFEVWSTIRGKYSEIERFSIFNPARTIENVDVTDPQSVRRSLDSAKPDVVINAAGVIKQLPESKDIVNTLLINSIFPHRLAGLAEELGFKLISISTDCVFDGKKGAYTEVDDPDALDLYGRSKNLGEVTGFDCLILRTSIIGRELVTRHSLVEWFLSHRDKKVNGFVNAIYSGFPTIVFADIITDLILNHRGLNGLYHVSSDPISKFQLLNLLNKYYQGQIVVEPFEDFTIDRSLDSSKFQQSTGFEPETWEIMVERMASDPTPYNKWRK